MKKPLVTCLLLSMTFAAYGQFNKYESASKFSPSKKGKKSETTVSTEPTVSDEESAETQDAAMNEGEEGSDIFGHGTGIGDVTNVVQDKKYVTLNPETAFGPEVVTSFDFPNVTLTDLTKHMQKLTGMNLILDSKELKGKISIVAPTPITVGDAWKAYLTALHTNGYALVKSGAFYRIVPDRDIRTVPTKIYTGSYSPETDNFVMRIIQVKNINASEVERTFRNFTTRYGKINTITQTNTLIIQDTGANVNRLVRLLKFIDVSGHEDSLQIIKVKHSSAQEIAKLLDQILKGNNSNKLAARVSGGKEASQNISKIIAEPRTNSIIAMANAVGAKQLRDLIEKLDVTKSVAGSEQIHVYYLNYGDSETLSTTLSSLVGSAGKKQAAGTPSFLKADEGDVLFSAPVKITADKANNAIVVTASPTDYLTIKEVIKKLDIPRDQVYVEGMIMETTVNRDKEWSTGLLGAYGTGGAEKVGFGDMSGLTNVLTGNITNLSGLFAGGKGGRSIDYTDPKSGKSIKINSVNGLIRAVATNDSTNVMATPQILALDNTEAVFEVGETVPTQEKTDAANGSSSFTRKDQKVTLTLKITPQINKVTRFVKLKIDQKVDDFSGRTLPSENGFGTITRSAITTVVCRDRDTIAMGGLMRDKEIASENKVPLLGDIPLIGWLFKSKKKTVNKVNILFFLTPKILASYENTAAKTMKDLLVRRSAHLKEVLAGDDPFIDTTKALYKKADAQDKGPLYDINDAQAYLQRNQSDSIRKKVESDEEENQNESDAETKVEQNKPMDKIQALQEMAAPVSPVKESIKADNKTVEKAEEQELEEIINVDEATSPPNYKDIATEAQKKL